MEILLRCPDFDLCNRSIVLLYTSSLVVVVVLSVSVLLNLVNNTVDCNLVEDSDLEVSNRRVVRVKTVECDALECWSLWEVDRADEKPAGA